MNNQMNITNIVGGEGKFLPGKKSGIYKTAAADVQKSSQNDDAIDSANSGLQTTDNSGVSSFKKIYNEVAQNNKKAQCKAETKSGTELKPDDAAVPSAELVALLGADTAQCITNIENAQSGATVSQQAARMIQDAVSKISQELNLTAQPSIGNLSLVNPSKDVVDQLAEMLTSLKGIADVLDQSVTLNQPVECPTQTLDVAQAAQAEQTIRTQIFTIQMALSMAGIAGDVAQSMSEKNNGLAQSDIALAANPSLLSMPATQSQQVIGNALAKNEQNVETLLQKLSATLSESGVAEKPVLTNATIATVALSTQEPVDTKENAVVKTSDSQVLRKLLKIDATQAVSMENKEAAKQNDALKVLPDSGILTSKSLADTVQLSSQDAAATLAVGPQSQDNSQNSLFAPVRAPETGTPRQLEESVMNQVTDNLQAAVKNGVTEMRVLLRPEALGEVQLKIRVEGDVVMGKMYVENQQVKHIVEANLQTLKDSLSQHNLHIGSFDVDINHGNDTQQQMRDMAQMAMQNSASGEDDVSQVDNKDNGGTAALFTNGIETGRKFGTNSIEYFA